MTIWYNNIAIDQFYDTLDEVGGYYTKEEKFGILKRDHMMVRSLYSSSNKEKIDLEKQLQEAKKENRLLKELFKKETP